MKKNKKKKGEITSGQLVSIILLIISFVIILLLFKTYNWNPIIDKETCHESIVFRSTVNYGFIKSSKIVPLKCQTEKICMSMSGEDCMEIGKNSKINPVTKIKLDSDPVKAKQEIIDKLTETMYECHSMLGEGQLLFMPNEVLGGDNFYTKKNYCLICTRIVLDEESKQKIEDVKYTELYQALSTKVNPQGKSYLEYLYPDWKDWHSLWRLFQQFKESNLAQLKDINDIEEWKINMSENGGFAIVGQIAPTGYLESFVESGAGLGVAALAATVIGAPVMATIAGSAAIGGVVFWYSSPTGGYSYSPPAVVPYNLENLRGMNCDSFETAP